MNELSVSVLLLLLLFRFCFFLSAYNNLSALFLFFNISKSVLFINCVTD